MCRLSNLQQNKPFLVHCLPTLPIHYQRSNAPTNECTSNAHNSVCGVQHAGILAAVLHAAVDAGEDCMARIHKGAEAKGDRQAVQVHGDCLGHMDATSYKVVHNHTCATAWQC